VRQAWSARAATLAPSGLHRTPREPRANKAVTTVGNRNRHDDWERGSRVAGAPPIGQTLKSLPVVPNTSMRTLQAGVPAAAGRRD